MPPVTNEVLEDAKNNTRLAMSSVLPNLPNETLSFSILRTAEGLSISFFSQTEPLKYIFPDAIALIRILFLPSGLDMHFT